MPISSAAPRRTCSSSFWVSNVVDDQISSTQGQLHRSGIEDSGIMIRLALIGCCLGAHQDPRPELSKLIELFAAEATQENRAYVGYVRSQCLLESISARCGESDMRISAVFDGLLLRYQSGTFQAIDHSAHPALREYRRVR